MQNLRITITQQTHGPPLTPNTAFLVATEDGLRHRLLRAVDEDAAGFELFADAQGLVDVFAPDAGGQAGVGGVGAEDDFGDGGPGLAGDDGSCVGWGALVMCLVVMVLLLLLLLLLLGRLRVVGGLMVVGWGRGKREWEEWRRWGMKHTERFLGNDPRVIGRIINNSRFHKKSLTRLHHVRTRREFVPVLLAVGEKLRHLLILHLVLNRPQHHAFLLARPNFEGLRELHHRFDKGFVDGLVDVNPLRRDTHLAGVYKGAKGHLGRYFLNVHVRAHDAGVVAAEFQRHALERLGRLGHDFLARGDAAGEADFLDARVADEPGAEFLVSAEHLHDAGRDDCLHELDELQGGVGGEGAGLDDDAVACYEGGGNLADGEGDGEIPWHNGGDDPERDVFCCDDLVIILDSFLW